MSLTPVSQGKVATSLALLYHANMAVIGPGVVYFSCVLQMAVENDNVLAILYAIEMCS